MPEPCMNECVLDIANHVAAGDLRLRKPWPLIAHMCLSSQAGNASRRAAAAASKAARRRRHHEGDQEEGGSGGGLFSKQNILLVMLLLMVLAQAVSYFEMWFGGGRR